MNPAFNAADKDVLRASDSMKVSFIGVPVRVDANVVGTPTIDRILDNKSSSLLDYDLRLLTTIANLVGQTAPWAAATVPSVVSDQASLAPPSAASLKVRVCQIASVSSRP